MYCILCKDIKQEKVDLLGVKVCESCYNDILTTFPFEEKYDYYKDVLKLVLQNYIYEKVSLNPVE